VDEHYFRLIIKVYDYAGYGELPDVTRTHSKPVPPETVASRLLKNFSLSWFALKQKGIPHLFVLQPSLAVTGKALTSREQTVLNSRIKLNGDHVQYFQSCYAKISAALSSFNVDGYRFVSMVEIFDQLQADSEMFIDSYHFGYRGNQIIAHKIYTEILSLLK